MENVDLANSWELAFLGMLVKVIMLLTIILLTDWLHEQRDKHASVLAPARLIK